MLRFAWVQGSTAMVAMVLLSLALGITLTIGVVAVVAILARNTMGATLGHQLPALERRARLLQGLTAIAIIAIGVYTLTTLWS